MMFKKKGPHASCPMTLVTLGWMIVLFMPNQIQAISRKNAGEKILDKTEHAQPVISPLGGVVGKPVATGQDSSAPKVQQGPPQQNKKAVGQQILGSNRFQGQGNPVLAKNFFGKLLSKVPEITTTAQQAYLIDLSTNTVLFEKNADQPMAPSSMTKIVTVYVLLKALAEKALDWSEKIYISENAAKKPGSRMFIKPNEMISVEDLLKGIIVVSGNDASTAIAEFLGGSEEGFSDMMNDLCASFGMQDSHFSNASGLPAENHYSTCKDLAKIAERTMIDFPKEYARFYKMTSFKYNGISQPNRNDLLKNGFAQGMKTGMTNAGKFGIVATAQRSGRLLLLVLNGVETGKLRAAEARKLLNWGFQRFESLVLAKGRILGHVGLWKEGSVGLAVPSGVAMTLPKGSLSRAKMVVRYHQPLTPPIRQNQRLGALVIDIPGQDPIEIPLVAEKDIEKPGIWSAVIGWFKALTASKISPSASKTAALSTVNPSK